MPNNGVLRRSSRIFNRQRLQLNNIAGRLGPRDMPLEIVILIVHAMIDIVEEEAVPIRWPVEYDRRNFATTGQAPLSTFSNLVLPHLGDVRRRMLMIHGPLQACKLFNRIVQRRFGRLSFIGGWRRESVALVLPTVDTFSPGWSIFTPAPFPSVDPSTPLIQPGELLTTVRHLEMDVSCFSRALARGTASNQPLSTFSSIQDITLVVDRFDLPLLLQNARPAPDGIFSMTGPGIPKLSMIEADLGHRFVEYWQPFSSRGVRLFVLMFRESRPTLEAFVTPSGFRLRRV